VILAALLLSACPAAAPLPEGDAYVRGLLDAQRDREEAVSRYSYDVSEVVEDLDTSGGVRKRRTRELEVYFVKGRPVRQLVGRNGQPLTGRERQKEERRAREEAEAITKVKIALGLAFTVKTLAFRAEFAHLEDGVWLPRSLETLVVGRKLLVSALRVRTTLNYGRYRRFDVEVDERLRADEANTPKAPPPKPEL
jgi:hypothetical protein